jgi:hypothetical protein
MRRARAANRVPAAFAVACLAAGCGSGTVTQRDYLARADAICAGALRKARSIPPPVAPASAAPSPGAFGPYLAQLLPVVRGEADQLRALKKPAGTPQDLAVLRRYLDAVAETERDYAALAAAAQAGDAQGVSRAEASLRASPAASLAARYGLRTCGTPGSTSVG